MNVAICQLDELVPNSVKRFDVHGVAVAVIRLDDKVYAIGDTCTHGEVSLSEGELLCADLELECWKHGSAFSVVTGQPSTLPATQPVPVYVATVVDGTVEITVEVTQS